MVIDLPATYWLSAFLLAVAGLRGLLSMRASWAPGYFAVLGTVFAWYFVEPFYLPEEFIGFTSATLDLGFLSVSIFLLVFVMATPHLVRLLRPRRPAHLRELSTGSPSELNVERISYIVIAIWAILLAFGVWRVDGDIVDALFPLGARSGTGVAMWGRAGGADAGPMGFLVSSGSYLYQLCLSAFGLLLPMTRKRKVRYVLLLVILISWPYAFLQGARNIALAVVVPFFASFMLYGRANAVQKIIFLAVGFYVINDAMLIVVNLRNDGFANIDLASLEGSKHLGLNMASELMHITSLIQNGVMDVSYGSNYIAHVANVVPRAVWPEKPLTGIEYAIARGFGGADNDIGVFATISMGLIGQGVVNFGSFFGPAVVGILMAAWVGVLNRMRVYGGMPRTALFLIGLGTTFNLGRDITLLTLFPFVFGYVGMWLLEAFDKRRMKRALQSRVASRA